MMRCEASVPSAVLRSNANGHAISFNVEDDHNVGTREFGQCASSSPLALRRPSSRSARLSSSTAFNVPPTRRTRPRRFGISMSDDVVGEGANIDLFTEDVSIRLDFAQKTLPTPTQSSPSIYRGGVLCSASLPRRGFVVRPSTSSIKLNESPPLDYRAGRAPNWFKSRTRLARPRP